MLFDEWRQNVSNLLLLASRQPRSSIKQLPHFSGGSGSALLGTVLAKKGLDGNAER